MSINNGYTPGSTDNLTEAPRHMLEDRVKTIKAELETRGLPKSKPRGNRYWSAVENELNHLEFELSVRAADDEVINQLEALLAEA